MVQVQVPRPSPLSHRCKGETRGEPGNEARYRTFEKSEFTASNEIASCIILYSTKVPMHPIEYS